MSLFFQRESAAVTLRVDESPPSARVQELTNMVALTDAALRRVEDNPRLAAHLASGPPPPSWRTRLVPVLAGVMGLGLGCGAWRVSARDSRNPLVAVQGEASGGSALFLSSPELPPPKNIAYPLPARPFQDQALAPCKLNRDEVEINGGCWIWMAIKRDPPCLDIQAEYQETCYVPVAKRQARPAQSAGP